MSSPSNKDQPVYGPNNIGVEIVIVEETNRTTERTRRPISEAQRKAREERLKKMEEWRKQMEKERRARENGADGQARDKP